MCNGAVLCATRACAHATLLRRDGEKPGPAGERTPSDATSEASSEDGELESDWSTTRRSRRAGAGATVRARSASPKGARRRCASTSTVTRALSSAFLPGEGRRGSPALSRHQSAGPTFGSLWGLAARRGKEPVTFLSTSISRSQGAADDAAGSGGGDGGCSSGTAAVVAQECDELLLLRVAVDLDGAPYISKPSQVCDACSRCSDTCEVRGCRGCDAKRSTLAKRFGEALAPAPSALGLLGLRHAARTEFSTCEVRRHVMSGSAWIVCGRHVYDVTACLDDHPGGKRSILRNCGGRDCEEDFGFHSRAAQKEWRQFRIGRLVPCGGTEGVQGGCEREWEEGQSRPAACRNDCTIS